MTISKNYFTYLEHFANSKPVASLLDDHVDSDLVVLRHDVDHDLDIALELAYHEHKRGFRASYFILHDHEYNSDPLFLEKLLQLQEYGHEIGVHLNVLAGWLEHNFDNPITHLQKWLANVRSAGINIEGAATHGAKACYQYGVLNSWLFSEQKKLRANYVPLSAEGIPDPTGQNNIPFPQDMTLERSDGQSLDLWSVSASEFGLKYEAVDLDAKYWSDTGKDWHRTGDPLDADLSHGRHQVLMHPIHWLAEPRKIFFVSTARVGSKWTANAVKQCTSAKVEHEWTLNHRQRDGKNVSEKVTTLDTQMLEKHRGYAEKLIQYSERFHSRVNVDLIEFNVYLVDYIDEIISCFPDAEIYGLVRDGADVVGSLLSRGWYASPNSPRYPYSERYSEQGLNQFERACSYWNDVNQAMRKHCKFVYKIETLSNDPESFGYFLDSLGLPVHRRLIDHVDFIPYDPSINKDGYKTSRWSKQQQASYLAICGEIATEFSYKTHFPKVMGRLLERKEFLIGLLRRIAKKSFSFSPTADDSTENLLDWRWSGSVSSVKLVETPDQSVVEIKTDGSVGWVVIDKEESSGGSTRWNKIGKNEGWALGNRVVQIDGLIKFKSETDQTVRLFYLEYDSISGDLVAKKVLTQLTPGWRGRFSEVIAVKKNRVRFGIYLSESDSQTVEISNITISKFEITFSDASKDYLF